MNIKNLRHILHEMRHFKRLVKKYGKSLYEGRYRLFPSMRAIVLERKESIEQAKPYFDKKIGASKKTALISKANALGYYRNRKRGDGEKYEAIYAANNYDKIREIKLFSFGSAAAKSSSGVFASSMASLISEENAKSAPVFQT